MSQMYFFELLCWIMFLLFSLVTWGLSFTQEESDWYPVFLRTEDNIWLHCTGVFESNSQVLTKTHIRNIQK